MPTSAEFEPKYPDVTFVSPGDYAREGLPAGNVAFTWGGTPNTKTDGTYAVSNGYRLEYATGKDTYLPAAGNRNNTGILGNLGIDGYYWGASPSGTDGRYLYFNGTTVSPANTSVRQYACPVRCVKK
jgi:hypothetical protein